MVREETTCPPSGRICSRAQAIAAIPLDTPSAASIPSMAASFFPKAATVGFAWRLYRYLPGRVAVESALHVRRVQEGAGRGDVDDGDDAAFLAEMLHVPKGLLDVVHGILLSPGYSLKPFRDP